MTLNDVIAAVLGFFGVKDDATVAATERFVRVVLVMIVSTLLMHAIAALQGQPVDWRVDVALPLVAGVLAALSKFLRDTFGWELLI